MTQTEGVILTSHCSFHLVVGVPAISGCTRLQTAERNAIGGSLPSVRLSKGPIPVPRTERDDGTKEYDSIQGVRCLPVDFLYHFVYFDDESVPSASTMLTKYAKKNPAMSPPRTTEIASTKTTSISRWAFI